MTLDVRGVFRDAWAMWQRDRGVLIWVAGFFLFLPYLALFLFVPKQQVVVTLPKPGQAPPPLAEQMHQLAQLLSQSAVLIAMVVTVLFAVLAILILYLDGARRDVGGSLLTAVRRLPAFFALNLIVECALLPGGVALGAGGSAVLIAFFYLGGLYLLGRLILAMPIFIAEPGTGIFAAVSRSFRATRGFGLVLAGFATIISFAPHLLAQPAVALGDVLDGAPLANPVAGIIIDVLAAALASIGTLGGTLLRIALYRRIGASNGI